MKARILGFLNPHGDSDYMRTLMICAGAGLLLAASLDAQRRPGMGNRGGRSMNDPDAVWGLLVKTHDKNKDGKITAEEYNRGEEKFNTYDADANGILTKSDLMPLSRGATTAKGVAGRADMDGDGKVSQDEWDDFISETDANGDATLSSEEISKVFSRGGRGQNQRGGGRRGMLGMFDSDGDGEITFEEMSALFAEIDRNKDGLLADRELPTQRNRDRAAPRRPQPPKAGELAPDWELPSAQNPEEMIRLSSFKDDKPVALIFGSHT